MATLRRIPIVDSSVQWNRSAGADNFALVDDPISSPDDDATYTYTLTQTNKDYFGFATFAIPTNSVVTNIKVTGRFKRIDAGGDYLIRELVKVNGVTYEGAMQQLLVGDYFDRSETWTTNPNTGQPWTVDDVNGVGSNPLQTFGYECIGFNKTVRCTQVYIEVNYEPTGAKKLMRDVATDKLMRDSVSNKLMRAEPIEYGNDCVCFAAGRTPKYISITFADIVLCASETDSLLNGTWILTQKVGVPCSWEYWNEDAACIMVALVNDPVQTFIQASGQSCDASRLQFSFSSGSNCDIQAQYANGRIACPPSELGGYGGTADIIWGV